MTRAEIKVLLIEDDEDDYILVRSLLAEITTAKYLLDWVDTYEEALEAISRCEHDAYLLDFRLGEHTGIELLSEVTAGPCDSPIILLTGQGGYEVDLEAMKAGAADYLVKNHISAPLLERSIRYAIERKASERELWKYKTHLEELVDERTKQLEDANSHLRQEIEERLRVEAALRESESKFRDLADLLPISVFELDDSNRVAFLNRTGFRIFGITPGEFESGLDALAFIAPEDRPRTVENIRMRMRGESVGGNEYSARKKDGETFPAVIYSSPIMHDDRPVGLRGILIDITERKKAEERVLQQNEFLRHVIESLTHPFYVLDANNYHVIMANSAATEEGLPENTTCYSLTHGRTTPCAGEEHFCPLDVIKLTKKPITVEHVHYDRRGNPRNVEVHAYPVFDRQGNVVQIIEYSFDITDRKQMQEELERSAEKIKLFAYSVSHDLKSPIIGIHGLTRLLHKQYYEVLDEKGRIYCDQILSASEQTVALIDEINTYIRTKETPLNMETLDPGEVLRMIRDEFATLLNNRGISLIEPDELPSIKADKMGLLRVFRNLIDNALKYGGEEMSEIRIVYTDAEKAHIFSIADNGIGIRSEDCEKVFGIFERNVNSNGIEGTGLGLAIVKEIIQKHGGSVWAKPKDDRGVVFYVSISKAL